MSWDFGCAKKKNQITVAAAWNLGETLRSSGPLRLAVFEGICKINSDSSLMMEKS